MENMKNQQQDVKQIKENEQCPICQHSFYFDDAKIPTGAMYSITCPKCGFYMRRKKIQ